MCTGRVTSCSNTVRQHVTVTNCFVCTGEFLWKSLLLQQVTLNLCNLLLWQILLQRQRFSQISPVHTQRFVAAMCHRNMLLNLSPSVYTHLNNGDILIFLIFECKWNLALWPLTLHFGPKYKTNIGQCKTQTVDCWFHHVNMSTWQQ